MKDETGRRAGVYIDAGKSCYRVRGPNIGRIWRETCALLTLVDLTGSTIVSVSIRYNFGKRLCNNDVNGRIKIGRFRENRSS